MYCCWRGAGHATPKDAISVYWLFWDLKNRKFRERLFWTSLICLKTENPKGTQLSSVSSPRVSSTREDWLITREESKSRHHTQTNFITNYYTSYLFCRPFIFPKNHVLSPERPTSSPLSLLRWYLMLEPPGGVTHFPLGFFPVYIMYTH